MRFLVIRASLLLLAFVATTRLSAQGLAISHVDAEPAELSCSAGPTEAMVTVQISFDSGAAGMKNREIEVSISGWSGVPPSNRLQIKDPAQTVSLNVSPAIAKFRVACGRETSPGKVVLFGAVDNPPPGAKMDERPIGPESLVTIKIRK